MSDNLFMDVETAVVAAICNEIDRRDLNILEAARQIWPGEDPMKKRSILRRMLGKEAGTKRITIEDLIRFSVGLGLDPMQLLKQALNDVEL